MDKYTFTHSDYDRAKHGVMELERCLQAGGVTLAADELDHMRFGFLRGLWPYIREREKKAAKQSDLTSSQIAVDSHKYDALADAAGAPRISDKMPGSMVNYPDADWFLYNSLPHFRLRLSDLFTSNPGEPNTLRKNWEDTVKAAYTKTVPECMRGAFDMLQDEQTQKILRGLAAHLGGYTLQGLCNAMDNPETLLQEY